MNTISIASITITSHPSSYVRRGGGCRRRREGAVGRGGTTRGGRCTATSLLREDDGVEGVLSAGVRSFRLRQRCFRVRPLHRCGGSNITIRSSNSAAPGTTTARPVLLLWSRGTRTRNTGTRGRSRSSATSTTSSRRRLVLRRPDPTARGPFPGDPIR